MTEAPERTSVHAEPLGPPIETAHDLSRRITDLVAARVSEAERSYLRGLRLPKVYAGHVVGSDTTAKLLATLSWLRELGVTKINGVDSADVASDLLDDLDPAATEAFSSYTVGEAVLRLGGLARARNADMVVSATRTPETIDRVRAGALPPNWVVVVARCLRAEALLTGEEPRELPEFLERTRELFATTTGWVNDGIGDLTMYDAYTPDMYLFAEPLADSIGEAWRVGLRNVLVDLDDLAQPGGAIVWGRSIGALALSLTVELAGLAARDGLSAQPGVWLERARQAVDELDRWLPGGVIAAHQGRNEMFYRGPARRLQMTFDVLDKLLTAASWLREGTPVPLGARTDAWSRADRVVAFEPRGTAAAWTFRSHSVSFVLPILRGWSTDYLPSLRGPGLFECPTSGHPCFLPTVHVGEDPLVPADLAVAVDHGTARLRVDHAGWAPAGATATDERAIGGARRATYLVEGRTVRVDERIELDPAAIDRVHSVSLLVPEIAERRLTVTVEGSDATVDAIDTSGVAEWRSFWSEITTVHQIEIPVQPIVNFTWRVRPQLRVASAFLFGTGYDHTLYAPLAKRLQVRQAEWPGTRAESLTDSLADVDVLHVAWPEWWTGVDPTHTMAVLDEVRANGVKIVWTMHNLVPHMFKHEDAVACYQLWAEAADGVIHHSDWGRAEALATYDYRSDTLHAVIPHGHWGARYDAVAPPSREAIERAYGWEPCAIRLAVIGTARAEKDLQLVLDAFHACRRDDLQLVARIAGDEKIPDDPRISIDREPLAKEAFVERMAAIDALILPFAPHGMLTTGTAFDAIGAGLAPVTSSWGFFDEVFAGHDIRYGETVEDLRRCLDSLTRAQIDKARAAMPSLRAAFEWDDIATRHLEFLEAVCDR